MGFGLGYCAWIRNSLIGGGRRISNVWPLSAKLKTVSPGTGSSNPALTSGESAANSEVGSTQEIVTRVDRQDCPARCIFPNQRSTASPQRRPRRVATS